MSSPETPAETPEPRTRAWSAQPTYSNLGEIRSHLLPSKACRPRTPGSLSADRQPPPLPKKTLTRTQSLPTHRNSSTARPGQPRKPLLASHSVDESREAQQEAGPPCPLEELSFSTPDASLGHFFQDLRSVEAVHAALAARQLASLATIHARLRTRLTGGRPGPCHSGHSFRFLDNSPCVDSGDALYYRVVRVEEDAWHILAAKVPTRGARGPDPGGLELQASLPSHFNLQSLCGSVPERVLPAAPWRGPAALVAEVPERTVAQWLAEGGARRPPDSARVAALLLLQLSAALEQLEARGAALADLRPEGLLLATPRGCAATEPPRLLLADFGRARPQHPGSRGAHALPLSRLVHALLSPAAARSDPLAAGLAHLAAQLLRRRPSAALTRGALQALLWGPGPSLSAHGAPLGSWLQVRRALLGLHLAERAAGGEAPGLEEWLCCEYLGEATEDSMARALELLWD
ncbi:protein PEAK3 [Tenrec ecaudatus]|uniref:protein PEAK3 n=1 Tax=Tenrec ecaudatus TaxID=94439 RepID=UPI003F5A20E0